eukprot:1594847-Lingulodinium_polyedra.AAC.1
MATGICLATASRNTAALKAARVLPVSTLSASLGRSPVLPAGAATSRSGGGPPGWLRALLKEPQG